MTPLAMIGTAFRRSVSRFAEAEQIPVVSFRKGDRKVDVMHHLARRMQARRQLPRNEKMLKEALERGA